MSSKTQFKKLKKALDAFKRTKGRAMTKDEFKKFVRGY